MKILHVISTLQTGGAEHLMVDLLPALRDLGNDVELLLINGQRTPFYNELDKKGIKIHSIQESGKIYSFSHIFKATKFLKAYDVVHTHTSPCQFMMAFAKIISNNKVPLVTTEHSTTNHRRNKFWLKPIDKLMYKQYKTKICISEESKKNLVAHIGTDKNCIVINNGVDFNKFSNPIKDILPQIKTMIMVASMRDAKDQDTVIKALNTLGNNYKLHLVGDGVRCNELKQLTKDLGLADNVVFMGNQNNIPQLLRDSDFVILSSHWEGLSLSSIEGMASGRPFLASDVPGLGEIVRGYGIVFPEGDHQMLADEILRLTNDKSYYLEIASKCQERAKQFDIKHMAEQYNEEYKKLIS